MRSWREDTRHINRWRCDEIDTRYSTLVQYSALTKEWILWPRLLVICHPRGQVWIGISFDMSVKRRHKYAEWPSSIRKACLPVNIVGSWEFLWITTHIDLTFWLIDTYVIHTHMCGKWKMSQINRPEARWHSEVHDEILNTLVLITVSHCLMPRTIGSWGTGRLPICTRVSGPRPTPRRVHETLPLDIQVIYLRQRRQYSDSTQNVTNFLPPDRSPVCTTNFTSQ